MPFIPPVLLDFYRRIKKITLPVKSQNTRTSSQIVATRTIPIDKDILSKADVDRVKIESYMEWINPFDGDDIRKYQYNELFFSPKDNNEISLDFTNYGSWTISIGYFCRDNKVGEEIKKIVIDAPEYNIGYLAATFPVNIFLTKLWEITSSDKPTIIGLERVLIDYDKLPQHVFPFPLASREELYAPYKGFNNYSQRLVSYIGMLYRLNPNAKFNLYLCDHQAYYSLALMYANGIPEKNFTVFLLCDGTGSYWGFNNIFNNSDAEKKYKAMHDTLALSKQEALNSGVQEWGKETFVNCGNPCVSEMKPRWDGKGDLSNRTAYAFVFAKDNSNYKWLLHNPKWLKSPSKIVNPLPDNICKIDFSEAIKNLKNHKSELISMLGIDYSVFDNSLQNNKKICLLLSSYPPPPDEEKYVDKTLSFFGNEFDYYFKEHPWTPSDTKRQERLKAKGLTFLNPKIPTEFFMLINPNVYIAGFCSSSFLSLDLLGNPIKQVLSVWDSKYYIIKTDYLDFTAKTAMNLENGEVVVYEKTN